MHLIALSAGALAGLVDVALIHLADPAATGWVELQSFLAWLAMGWAVVTTPSRLPALAHGVVVTLSLDAAWLIALGPGSGHPEHVAPLVALSVVFGLAFGGVRRQWRR
jgi:hypothetical protein